MKKGFVLDDDPSAESSILFFKQFQNKMHWAAHKHTAAEGLSTSVQVPKKITCDYLIG